MRIKAAPAAPLARRQRPGSAVGGPPGARWASATRRHRSTRLTRTVRFVRSSSPCRWTGRHGSPGARPGASSTFGSAYGRRVWQLPAITTRDAVPLDLYPSVGQRAPGQGSKSSITGGPPSLTAPGHGYAPSPSASLALRRQSSASLVRPCPSSRVARLDMASATPASAARRHQYSASRMLPCL